MSIVDLSPILDEKFAREQITSFHNKFFAAMFNTFEEVLLLDADVVPYVSLDEFFNLKGYKDTGLNSGEIEIEVLIHISSAQI